MSKKFKTWDSYVTEAKKPPFELGVGEGKIIKIECPTGDQVIKVQSAAGVGRQLELLTGDSSDDVMPLVREAPAGAMRALVEDLMEHFGFSTGEDGSPT